MLMISSRHVLSDLLFNEHKQIAIIFVHLLFVAGKRGTLRNLGFQQRSNCGISGRYFFKYDGRMVYYFLISSLSLACVMSIINIPIYSPLIDTGKSIGI